MVRMIRQRKHCCRPSDSGGTRWHQETPRETTPDALHADRCNMVLWQVYRQGAGVGAYAACEPSACGVFSLSCLSIKVGTFAVQRSFAPPYCIDSPACPVLHVLHVLHLLCCNCVGYACCCDCSVCGPSHLHIHSHVHSGRSMMCAERERGPAASKCSRSGAEMMDELGHVPS